MTKHILQTQEYLESLNLLGYEFRLNACGDILEINGQPINDKALALIRTQMRDRGFVSAEAIVDACWVAGMRNTYHPVNDWLNDLQWDGKPWISTLAGYFTDTHGVFGMWLRRWLIGAVAKAIRAEQNAMLVLDGPQGLGKSRFVRWLASDLPEYFLEMPIDPNDKDNYLRLASHFVWEVPELGATTRRADRESLKHFLSVQDVAVRRAYGRYDTKAPAMASFVGTVNNESGLLNDPTGSRRFLVCHLERIDWGYSALLPERVWAEAVAAYRMGETGTLTSEEAAQRDAINALYETEEPLEGLLLHYFDVDREDEDAWLSTREILSAIYGERGVTKSNSMALSSVMTRLEIPKLKRAEEGSEARVWGYRFLHPRDVQTPSSQT